MALAPLRVGQHRCDRARVRRMDARNAAQMPLVLGRLLGEDVALERHAAPAAPAHAEALFRARLRLHLGHDFSLICCPLRCSPAERLGYRLRASLGDVPLPPSAAPSSAPAASPSAGLPIAATIRP